MRRLPIGCQVKFDWQARVPGPRFAYLQASDCSLARIVRLRRGSPSPGQLADPAREARLGSRPGPRLHAVMACARPPWRHAGVPAGGARRRLSRRSRPYSPLRPGALSAATPKLRAAGATARAAEGVDFGDAERGPAEPAAGELRAACKKWRDPNAPGKKKNPGKSPCRGPFCSVIDEGRPPAGPPDSPPVQIRLRRHELHEPGHVDVIGGRPCRRHLEVDEIRRQEDHGMPRVRA